MCLIKSLSFSMPSMGQIAHSRQIGVFFILKELIDSWVCYAWEKIYGMICRLAQKDVSVLQMIYWYIDIDSESDTRSYNPWRWDEKLFVAVVVFVVVLRLILLSWLTRNRWTSARKRSKNSRKREFHRLFSPPQYGQWLRVHLMCPSKCYSKFPSIPLLFAQVNVQHPRVSVQVSVQGSKRVCSIMSIQAFVSAPFLVSAHVRPASAP